MAVDGMRFLLVLFFHGLEPSRNKLIFLLHIWHIPRGRSSAEQTSKFYVGQWLDVKDTVNQWLEATVMEV